MKDQWSFNKITKISKTHCRSWKNSKNKQKLANKLNIILSPIINSDKRTQIDWINQRNLAIDIMCTLSYQCNP